jgi:hypothetical protein
MSAFIGFLAEKRKQFSAVLFAEIDGKTMSHPRQHHLLFTNLLPRP